jgi:hypothetical protein
MTKDEFTKLAAEEASRASGPCSSCFLDGAEWGLDRGVKAVLSMFPEQCESPMLQYFLEAFKFEI